MYYNLICILYALLCVQKFYSCKKWVLQNEKNKLFKNSIQAYVEYLEELQENGKKVAMKIIYHAWRSYKSRLVNYLWNKKNPFDTFKDVTQEDWKLFVTKCKSQDFVANSQYMQWL
jgi:hypothetical protein